MKVTKMYLKSANNYNTNVQLDIYDDSWTVIPPFGKIPITKVPTEIPEGIYLIKE